MAPGVDTLIGTFIAVAVTVALWILRGLRQDVRAVAARNFANFQTLQSLIAKVRGSKKPASVSWPAY